VTEDVLNPVDVHTLFVQQGGARVTQVMKADGPQARSLKQSGEVPVEVPGSIGVPMPVVKTSPVSRQSLPFDRCSADCRVLWSRSAATQGPAAR
jgi:hypothetical protein